MDPVLENLRKAREIVARPGGWCRGWVSWERRVEPAVCALGAVAAARGWDMGRKLRQEDVIRARCSPEAVLLGDVAEKLKPQCKKYLQCDTVITFNDSTDQGAVVEMFDTAICVREKQLDV